MNKFVNTEILKKCLPSARLNMRSTNRRWFTALIILLLTLTCVFFLIASILIRSHEKSLIRLHINANRLMQQNADSLLYSIQNQAISLSFDRTVQNLAQKTSWDKSDMELSYSISDSLYHSVRINQEALDIYIFFPASDMIIGSEGVYKAKLYYDLKQLPGDSSYSAWREKLEESRDGLTLLPQEQGEVLAYLRRIKHNNALQSVAVIEIDAAKLVSALESPDSESAVYFAGHLIASDSKSALGGRWPAYQEEYLHAEEGYRRNGANVLISNPSFFPGLLYLRQYQSSDMFNPVKTAFTLIIFVLGITLLSGFIWSIYITKKYGSSWNELVESLGSQSSEDDYDFVQARVAEVMSKYKDSSIDLQNKQNVLNSLFLQKVLQIGHFSESELFLLAQKYKINFTGDLFTLISYKTVSEEKHCLNLLSAALDKIAEELNFEYFLAPDGGTVRVLINFENLSSLPLLEDMARKLPETSGAYERLQFLSMSPAAENISKLFYTEEKEEEKDSPDTALSSADQESAENKDEKDNPGEEPSVSRIAREARYYIDEKFDDPLLGLYAISEHVGVSESYLSGLFKQTYGLGITSYINHKRVGKAKALITTTDLSIKEIAEIVGFSSDINFIRVFKRLENSTPGSLRKKKK